jgi:hypothetical protein
MGKAGKSNFFISNNGLDFQVRLYEYGKWGVKVNKYAN